MYTRERARTHTHTHKRARATLAAQSISPQAWVRPGNKMVTWDTKEQAGPMLCPINADV